MPHENAASSQDTLPRHAPPMASKSRRPDLHEVPPAYPSGTGARRHVIPARRLVAAFDVALVLLALLTVLVAQNLDRMPHGLDGFLSIRVTLKNVLLMALFAASCAPVFALIGLYDGARLRHWGEETLRGVLAVALVTPVAALFPLSSRSGALRFSSLLTFWLVASALIVVARSARATLSGRRTARRRVLIVGTGPQALRIHRELCADTRTAYQVLGFVDTTLQGASPFLARRTLGSLDDLEEMLAREHVDEVRIGLPVKSHYLEIARTLRVCERVGVKAAYHADIFESRIARPRLLSSHLLPLVEMHVAPDDWRLVIKRLFDVLAAIVGLVVLSPVLLAAAIAIKATSPGPVIFVQERYGLNRRRFRMFKFRTMVANAEQLQASLEALNEADGAAFKIARDPRVTPVGRFLRKTSVDELPQLVNVLRGDMSLVGPRPMSLRDVALVTRPSDMRRFSVRPGITCLWQISGRSLLGFDDWVRLDLQYIDHWSLALDLTVLARTLPAVVRGTGAA